MFYREHDSMGRVLRAQLPARPKHVVLTGKDAEAESMRNLLRALSIGERAQAFDFARRKSRRSCHAEIPVRGSRCASPI